MKLLQRLRPRHAAGLIAAVAIMITAGCGQNSPEVAAYVGSETISDSQLQRVTVATSENLETTQPLNKARDVLNGLVLGEIANQLGAAQGVRISDTQRDALIAPSSLAPLLRDDQSRQFAYALADVELVRQQIGDQAFVDGLSATAVTINPRYGSWRPEAFVQNQSMVGGESESLSVLLGSSGADAGQ